ncbi:hypothetical protein [Candidatus Binatus sp.]|uniref:hypothetical protein n=1 Tax=Candidatus Binatus sp. TaxID=2811406 RepID=UPI003C53AC5C
MAIRIEVPEDNASLTEFVLFHDRVYAYRGARWPASVEIELPLLTGQSPLCEGRTIRPFAARDGGELVARAVAVVDERYCRHWNERLGHVVMFEATAGARDAVKLIMDEACQWLESHGTIAARAGDLFPIDFPFVIDEYELLPPNLLRQNPDYYHSLLKDAGFETEQGMVDYKIEVTPALVARYESALEAARRAGFEIVPAKEIPNDRRVAEYIDVMNDAFKRHWGHVPVTREEGTLLDAMSAFTGGHETSVMAYREGAAVGALFVTPDVSSAAILGSGRKIADSEKLNTLGIGVREAARGRGVNLAMASYAFLQLIRKGAKYLSYTLVLDDNWPSRRTAEKLGAKVCANYLVYRRNFRV